MIEAKMTNEKEFDEQSSEYTERRAYEAPAIRDFFQPLVVLGSTPTVGPICESAKPKPPKY
jgi:hypothetical protein